MNMLELAQRLKAIRVERGYTLEQIATQAGLTRGWLSKVENFRVTPSLPALSNIASVLGITLSELFEGLDSRPPLVVIRKDERKLMKRDEEVSKLRYEALAHTRPDRAMDPVLITVPPDDTRPKLSHDGEEFLLVLEGTIEFEYDDTIHELHRGDGAYFDGDRPHRLICSGPSPARVLAVFHEPMPSGYIPNGTHAEK